MFDFRKLRYTEVRTVSTDPVRGATELLARSNHTSVFYAPHNT